MIACFVLCWFCFLFFFFFFSDLMLHWAVFCNNEEKIKLILKKVLGIYCTHPFISTAKRHKVVELTFQSLVLRRHSWTGKWTKVGSVTGSGGSLASPHPEWISHKVPKCLHSEVCGGGGSLPYWSLKVLTQDLRVWSKRKHWWQREGSYFGT